MTEFRPHALQGPSRGWGAKARSFLRALGQHGARRLLVVALRADVSPWATEFIGTQYGGWAIPTGAISSGYVCFTAGAGEDVSFDVELADRGCHVLAIDPTPRAIAHIQPFLETRARLKLAPYALWVTSGEIEFFPPEDPSDVSYSVANRQHTHQPIRVPARSIADLCAEYGYDHVDLLKLDIEGAEYELIPRVDLNELGVKVLCVEYHNDHGIRRIAGAVRHLKKRGFALVTVTGWDLTFVESSLAKALRSESLESATSRPREIDTRRGGTRAEMASRATMCS